MMKEQGDCTSGVCPGASANGETVSLYVPLTHPFLQLQRALPWDALAAVMERHWRQAGTNTARRPGLPWDVALYVPLMVLMLVKPRNAREMEAYVAENVVARICMGRQDAPTPQMRDHSNIARAYAALGNDGVEEINMLLLHVARD
jgi:hypothetical protein